MSARTKRTAAGKAKGSPLKVEIKAEEGDEWDEDVEVEVVTPSKVIYISSFGEIHHESLWEMLIFYDLDRNLDLVVLVLEVALGHRVVMQLG